MRSGSCCTGSATTRFKSRSASTNAAESRLLETLQYVSSYTIIADTMLLSGSGGTLKLRALPEEKKP